MCCGGSSSTQEIPEWVSDAGKETYGKAKDFAEQGYQPYTGQRQAAFTADQNSAFQQLRDYVNGGGNSAMATQGADLIAQGATGQTTQERIIDENGQLGAISDYMNPHVQAMLNPALRQIEEGRGQARKSIRGAAQSANAFGDARHGIRDAMLERDTMLARGDTTANAYGNAYNQAMAARSGDLQRFVGQQESEFARNMAGGQALTAEADRSQNALMTRLSSLLESGGLQQQQAQTALDIPYQEHQAAQQDEYDRLATLIGALGQVPYSRTTQNSDGGVGMLGGVGAILGGLGAMGV